VTCDTQLGTSSSCSRVVSVSRVHVTSFLRAYLPGGRYAPNRDSDKGPNVRCLCLCIEHGFAIGGARPRLYTKVAQFDIQLAVISPRPARLWPRDSLPWKRGDPWYKTVGHMAPQEAKPNFEGATGEWRKISDVWVGHRKFDIWVKYLKLKTESNVSLSPAHSPRWSLLVSSLNKSKF
jgi:hypothetical protein